MPDYLDAVERQLAQLTERGAHRRRVTTRVLTAPRRHRGDPGGRPPEPGPRRRGDVFVFAAALIVAVAVAAILLALRPGGRTQTAAAPAVHRDGRAATHRSHAQPTPRNRGAIAPGPAGAPAPSAGAAVPAGFAPVSFTAISEETWWLLGSAPCQGPPCTSIVRTTDGGRTFAAIAAPRARLGDASDGSGVSQLRFADPQNGFAFGGRLFVTHDGGAHWYPLALGGPVSDLAIAGGDVYAVVAGRALLRSPVGHDAWAPLAAAGAVSGGLWVHGTDVLVQAANQGGPGALLISHDLGQTFTREPAPPSIACAFEEPEPPAVWAHCATGTMSGVWRSAVGGVAFQPALGSGSQAPGQEPNSAAFGAASATTAVIGADQLYRTADGGATYTPVGPAGITAWRYLGFTDPTHGVAVGDAGTPRRERLYYTTDGGLTYHLVAIR